MSSKNITLHLNIWRQKGPEAKGHFEKHTVDGVYSDMSFLEMLDMLNGQLAALGKEPVQYDHDCREGICGACGIVINGEPHGPQVKSTTCELHMRKFANGDTLYIEPWRAKTFPILKDLAVDRTAYDEIIKSGGYIKINYGNAPEANGLPIGQEMADLGMDNASCIGCGACVAACKNASAMLFVAAKVSHLSYLPQGQIERTTRVQSMLKTMDKLGFGNCTNEKYCEDACPKGIKISSIGRMNREYIKSLISAEV